MEINSDIRLITIKHENISTTEGKFIIEPLMPGYGTTLGNALRRVLLSSLPGAAITAVRIESVDHEFTTIDGVKEDVVDLILNLKGVRIKLFQDEPATITLSVTGPKTILAGDFGKVANVEIVNSDHYIGTIDKKKTFILEAVVGKGVGYVPTERRKDQKLPIGTIAIDSIYTPVVRVNVVTENTRVGQMTNYDKLIVDIVTDGTIGPVEALQHACTTLNNHFIKIVESLVVPTEEKAVKAKKSKRK